MSAVALPALPVTAPAAGPSAPAPAPKTGEAGGFAKALQQAGGKPKEAAQDGADATDAAVEKAVDDGPDEPAGAEPAAGPPTDGSAPPVAPELRPDAAPVLDWLAGAATAAAPPTDGSAPPVPPELRPAAAPVLDWLAGAALAAADLAGTAPRTDTAAADAASGDAASAPAGTPLAVDASAPAAPGRRAPASGADAGAADADAMRLLQAPQDAKAGVLLSGATDHSASLPATVAAPASGGIMGAGAPGAAAVPEAARLAPPLHSPAFAPALGAQLSLMVRDGLSEARLHLNPAEMGPVSVRISIDGSSARVDLVADQAPTRQVLEQAMPVLAGALRESGLTLTGGGVFEQPRDARQPGADGQARPGRPGDGNGDPDAGALLGGAALPGDPLRAGGRRRGVVDLYA